MSKEFQTRDPLFGIEDIYQAEFEERHSLLPTERLLAKILYQLKEIKDAQNLMSEDVACLYNVAMEHEKYSDWGNRKRAIEREAEYRKTRGAK